MIHTLTLAGLTVSRGERRLFDGLDLTRYGIPPELVGSVDRLSLMNLVTTADAFASAGLEPEELLRWVSPVVYMRRTAQRDTEIRGVPIASGQKVVMYYGSANRDLEVFGPTAGELDLARSPNDHIAFGGGGPHFCLGAHIARVEIHALLRELLTRLGDLRPAGETEWLASTFISGPKHLPITFRAR